MSRAAVTFGALAAAIGVAGVVVGSVALAKVDSAQSEVSTVTVTATPEPEPASADDVHASAVETCAAAETFRTAVGEVRQPYVDAAKSSSDWNTPEFVALEGRYFGGVAAELDYLRSHLHPSTPHGIVDAVNELHRAATDLLDADVRRLSGDLASQALAKLRSTYDGVTAACETAGAGK